MLVYGACETADHHSLSILTFTSKGLWKPTEFFGQKKSVYPNTTFYNKKKIIPTLHCGIIKKFRYLWFFFSFFRQTRLPGEVLGIDRIVPFLCISHAKIQFYHYQFSTIRFDSKYSSDSTSTTNRSNNNKTKT